MLDCRALLWDGLVLHHLPRIPHISVPAVNFSFGEFDTKPRFRRERAPRLTVLSSMAAAAAARATEKEKSRCCRCTPFLFPLLRPLPSLSRLNRPIESTPNIVGKRNGESYIWSFLKLLFRGCIYRHLKKLRFFFFTRMLHAESGSSIQECEKRREVATFVAAFFSPNRNGRGSTRPLLRGGVSLRDFPFFKCIACC